MRWAMKKGRRAYVVDVAGLTRAGHRGTFFTTPEILMEAKGEIFKAFVDAKVDSREIAVREAKKEYLEKAVSEATRTGDIRVLSKADISLLALFLELSESMKEVVLLTDDFALQNIVHSLGLKARRIVGREIRDLILWRVYCSACGKAFPKDHRGSSCPDCGSPIKRRAISTSRKTRQ